MAMIDATNTSDPSPDSVADGEEDLSCNAVSFCPTAEKALYGRSAIDESSVHVLV